MTNNRISSNLLALFLIVSVSLFTGGCGGGGESTGASGSFAPVVLTMVETSVGLTSATLNGSVDPQGLETQAWFEWGTDPTFATYDNTSAQDIGASIDFQDISEDLTGLSIGTTYYYRVAAQNSAGTTRGGIESFVPSALPTVSTLVPASVGTSTASLSGSVNPNGLSTNAWFEWGTSATLSSYASTPTQSVGSGTTDQSVTAGLSGLSGGTTYYYRIAAQNSAGTSRGSIRSFSPASAPTVSTSTATSVGTSSATVRGDVTPNGLSTDAWFEWGTSATLSSYSSTSTQSIGSGTASLPVSAGLSGLSNGTTYYFRVAANNSAGTSKGSIRSFTTTSGSGAPTPYTLAPNRVATGAICNGKINPNGISSTAWIEWGTSPTLSTYTESMHQSIGSSTSNEYISEPLLGLSVGTTYYYRAVGNNSMGTTRGDITSFTVIAGTWVINDDFTSDDTVEYSVSGSGTFTHNASTGKAEVATGSGETLTIGKPLDDGTTGTFRMEFKPTALNGSGSNFVIRISDTALTYYEYSANTGWFLKYRKGVLVDSAQLPATYSVGNSSTIKISFDAMVVSLEAFGARVSMDDYDSGNPINHLSISATGMDATYDDIKLTMEQ